MRLSVRTGQARDVILDHTMRNLALKSPQLDEIRKFIGKKKKNVTFRDPQELGDVWTFVAGDADTKLVLCYVVGKRDSQTANAFLEGLASRPMNRVQISTHRLADYPDAVKCGFGSDVDYGQIIRSYSTAEGCAERIPAFDH